MEAGDVNVFPAVVVVVADGHAVSPTAKIQARLRRDIGKRAVMIVVIKARRMAFARAVVLDRRAINQKNVHPAVVVVVERGRATALGFDDVELLPAAASQVKINSSRARDVNEQAVDSPLESSHPAFVRPPQASPPDFACRCTGLWRSRLRGSRQNPAAVQC